MGHQFMDHSYSEEKILPDENGPEVEKSVYIKNVKLESEIHLPDEIQDQDSSEMISESNTGPDLLEQAISEIKGEREDIENEASNQTVQDTGNK